MLERTMYRGDTFVFEVQVFQARLFNQPEDAPTPPQNITGWKMWFTAKYSTADYDNAAVSQLDNGALGGVVFVDPTIGRAEITMPALATLQFPDGPVALVYDVQVQDAIGRISTVEVGTLTVNPDATRRIS